MQLCGLCDLWYRLMLKRRELWVRCETLEVLLPSDLEPWEPLLVGLLQDVLNAQVSRRHISPVSFLHGLHILPSEDEMFQNCCPTVPDQGHREV